MPLAGFEPTVPESERPQTDALDRAASGKLRSSTGIIQVTRHGYVFGSNKLEEPGHQDLVRRVLTAELRY